MNYKHYLIAVACLAPLSSGLHAQTEGFYRQPALHNSQIYFVAEGDIWRVSNKGGQADRITTHLGAESTPAVSADGQLLAFVAQYDGPGDVYVMPAHGGVPKRLSWEGSSQRVWGFSPSGEVIYSGSAQSGQPVTQLYAVDPKTQQRRTFPVSQAKDGAVSTDGSRLYFTRNGLTGDNARQYRGGAIAKLWTLDLAGKSEATPLIPEGSNDFRPMPYRNKGEERVAFLSDRDGTVNLWSVSSTGRDLRQHSRFKGWDIRHASIDGTKVSVAVGSDLHLLDLEKENASVGRRVAVTLGGDFDHMRERWIKKPQSFLTDIQVAPNGERILLNSRGHLATQGIGSLRRAEIVQPADGRCMKGVFSADSTQIFALCDFSGEREIWRFPSNGLGQSVQVTFDAKAMRTQLKPSPDGRYIAHTDKEGHLFLTDLKATVSASSTATRQIGHDQLTANIQSLTWSPDSSVLAFTQSNRIGGRSQLRLYNLLDDKTQTVTSDRYDTGEIAFTPDGRWLYFLSERNFSVTGNPTPWGDRNMGPFFDKRSKLYALALQPGQSFPFAPMDELIGSEPKSETKADPKGEAKTEAKQATKPGIVWSGLAERLYEVPVPSGNLSELRADAKRLWWLDTEVRTGNERKSTLKTVSIDRLGNSPETVSTDVRDYDLSADGKKLMLVRSATAGAAPDVFLVDAAPKLPTELPKFQVKWSDWQIAVDPKKEWQQMFMDAWRMHRDYFYDKSMHGVDWNAVRAKYEPLVSRVTDRAELAELMAQMVGELGALHSQVRVGDVRTAPEDPGLAGLGANFVRTEGGWRIEKIYRNDPELPGEGSPLARAGSNVGVGDVITAINGKKSADAPHPSELLRGHAGKQVLLQIRSVDGKDKQTVVMPVPQRTEQQLRYNDWRYSRAQAVDAASNGRIGYLHIRAMGRDDIADFAREFYANTDREGLIIDVRFNAGGNIDSWIMEKLLRKAWSFWQRRSPEGAPPYSNMQQAFQGHLVVIVNEQTYSDGETFIEGIKRLGLAPIIGKTSSGAGVWLSDRNTLVDNGMVRAAENGQIAPDGKFLIEGIGVKPNIEVDNLPRATFMGGDAQLDAAIAKVKESMRDRPKLEPKPGNYPRPVKLP